ncbi:MAG: methyl-accepting chemotaxis protein [Pontiellaceae bacterium]|nr:methyl-accepting chemotaxis protein [Pontiellaceae bacterium]MBN2785909.1 methyl-accepting chemotaxis protein [Pontiellaceae bacterium]
MNPVQSISCICRFKSQPRINEVCDALRRVNALSEQEFVKLGGKLQEFIQMGLELTERCNAMAQLLSGREFTETMNFKLEKLAEINLLIREIEIDYNWTHEILQNLLIQLDEISRPLGEISRQLIMLRTLGVSTLTCIAQLGVHGREFLSVAESLQEMTNEVEKNINSLTEQILPLKAMAGVALNELNALHSTSFSQISDVVTQFSDTIHHFISHRSEYENESAQLAKNYEAFTSNIMNIVVALQFQDFLRQSLEHSIEALDSLNESKCICNYRNISELSHLQKRQIEEAYGSFASEVQQVTQNLEKMSEHAHNDMRDAEHLERIPVRLTDLANTLNRKVVLVNDYSRQMECMNRTSKQVTFKVETMFEAVRNMNAIDSHIRLLGLNSTIKAARIGEGGEALITLAEAIRACASEISSNGSKVSVMLGEVVRRFATFNDSRKDKDMILHEIEDRLSSKTEAINALKSTADTIMSEISTCGHRVVDELERGMVQINATEQLSPVVGQALGSLAFLNEEGSRLQKMFAFIKQDRRLEQTMDGLYQKYTIDAERETHQRFLRERGLTMAKKPASPTAKKDDALLWSNEATETTSDSTGFDDFESFDDFEDFTTTASESMSATEQDEIGNIELFEDFGSAAEEICDSNIDLFDDFDIPPSAENDPNELFNDFDTLKKEIAKKELSENISERLQLAQIASESEDELDDNIELF